MKHNYHTHTPRCGHARGTEREFIEAALNEGYETLGFSDHTPQFFAGDYYSNMRMRPELLADYVSVLQKLKWEYRDKIDILIGVELEYYPQNFERLHKFLRESGVEYMIMGQHFLGWEQGERYTGSPSPEDPVARLERYIAQTKEGLKTGLFTYFAHPDLLRFTGDNETYRKLWVPYLRELKAMNVPLELNLYGLNEDRIYPSKRFFALAREVGNTVVYGTDAHWPDFIRIRTNETKADGFCASIGLEPYRGKVEIKRI